MMSDGYSIGFNRVANLRRYLDSVDPGCASKSAGPLAIPNIYVAWVPSQNKKKHDQ